MDIFINEYDLYTFSELNKLNDNLHKIYEKYKWLSNISKEYIIKTFAIDPILCEYFNIKPLSILNYRFYAYLILNESIEWSKCINIEKHIFNKSIDCNNQNITFTCDKFIYRYFDNLREYCCPVTINEFENISDQNMDCVMSYVNKLKNKESIYKCKKCKKNDTLNVSSAQTRGLDEPETIIIHCRECDIIFRI